MDITQARTAMRNGKAELKAIQAAEAAGTITGKTALNRLVGLQAKLDEAQATLDINAKAHKLAGGWDNSADVYDDKAQHPSRGLLGIAGVDMKNLHRAIEHGTTYRTKAVVPSFVHTKDADTLTGLLAPDVQSGVLQARHEPNRVMSWFPAGTTGLESVQYIRHSGNTGAVTAVPEAGAKPNVAMAFDKLTAGIHKIAAYSEVTDESLKDFANLESYVQVELTRLLFDAENAQLLNGDATGANFTGLLTPASGIPTAAKAAGDTNLDAVEKALTILRTGSAKTQPNALFMSPGTFSILRRSKDQYGRYLLDPDPRADDIASIWGIPAAVNTAMPDGTILIADTGLLATIWVREGITVAMDASGDRFTHNLTAFRVEERFGLAVTYPAAGYILTGIAAA